METTTTVQLPKTATPGPEVAALAPFYKNATWTGVIEAGGMGPGSPKMIGKGSAQCRLIQSGLWYDCDFEQSQYLVDGTFVLKWQLHWITGWDPKAGEYRATSADNNGPTLEIYRGKLDDKRLVYEPVQPTLPKIRLTWELTEADNAKWRNEYSLDGKNWSLIEQYDMHLTGRS